MQPLLNRLRSLLDRVLQGALPDDRHAPAESMEHLRMAPVASDISLEFLPPEIFIGPGSGCVAAAFMSVPDARSEEHTSELQSLMRISYAVFCLKKKNST